MDEMKTKRIAFGFLILSLLACNFVTQMVVPSTATPAPTITPTVTASPSPAPNALAPAFIPPQCAAKPIATISPDIAVQPTPAFETQQITKRKQLQILNEIESIVDDVYVYPDYNGKDWKGMVARYRTMVEAGLDTDAFYLQMQTMISELGDEHSSFITPVQVAAEDAELRGETKFVGMGIYHNINVDKKKIIVISTFPDSPAEHGGLQAHDSILSLDGMPIGPDTYLHVRGPECSAVVLTVQSPGESPRDVMLIRASINGSIPIDARLVTTSDGSKIGYIYIPSFFDETLPRQIENALKDFGRLDGLILDVRMNSGGSNTVVYPILSFFTKGTLGNFVSRADSKPLTIEANPINNSQTVPLVVMVSKETVSFGEIFAGILRDVRKAKITGETSLGNVEVLHGYNFKDGSVLWLAFDKFDSAFSDDDWEKTGIVPDIQAYADWDTFYFDTDPSIAAALKLLGHQ
jgi:carboxyl-terminal processing protease